MYHIACFPASDESQEDEVEIIHDTWILPDGNNCYFPPYLKGQLKKALITKMQPRDTWKIYSFRILKSYENYEKASMMVSAAEETSNLESDAPTENLKRKKKRNFSSKPKCQDNSSGDESESGLNTKKSRLPLPPAITSVYQTAEISQQSPDIMQLNRMIENNSSCQVSMLGNKEALSSTDLTPTPFQRKVIKWMERTDRILETQSSAIDKILTLLTLQNNQNGQCQMMDDIPKLPLNTLDEMNEFEQYIQESSNFNKMVQYFSVKGGNDVEDTTKRILKSIMTQELMSVYNWAGRGDKIAFKHTTTKRLIIYAVRKNKTLEGASEQKMEDVMKDVLKYAPLRAKYAEKNYNKI